MDGESSNVFHGLSDAVRSMDIVNEENQRLRSDVEFTKSEVARLRALVEAAAHELANTQQEVEALALKREDMERNSLQNAVYQSIQETEEANRTILLEKQTQQLLQRSILQEASSVAAAVELLKAQIEDRSSGATSESGDLTYIKNLEAAVASQNSEINRARFNKEQLERDEAQMELNEREILRLRESLESCGLDVPVAPIVQRATLLRRRRERTAAAAGVAALLPSSTGDAASGDQSFMSNFIAMKGSGGNTGGPSFIRPVIYGGGGHLGLSTSAATGSRKVRSRSFEIPCGWLQPLTSIIGPVRKLASEYSLERAHMGSKALEDHVVWLRPGGGAASSSTTRHGSSGGQHQPQATFLHAHGANAELDRFEQQFLNAMEKTSRLVARYDGLVTYTQSFGAQQQDETTQKLLNLVAAPSPLAIQSSLSPPPHNSGHHHHRGDATAAERDALYHTESAEYHATPPPASSTNGQRRVTVSTTPSLSAHHDTPMTIAGEEETP